MKMAPTTPLMATGDTLAAWAEGDATYDLFLERSAVSVVGNRDMAIVRPAIVTRPGQVVWGFHYRSLWQEFPTTEFPVLIGGDAAPPPGHCELGSGLRVALAAEHRRGEYRLSELERIRRLVERCDAVEPLWNEIAPLLSADADPWPLIERFRRLSAVLGSAVDAGVIDLRTAEAIPQEWAAAAGWVLPLFTTLSFSNRRQALRMAVELLRGGTDGELLVEELAQLSPQEILPALRRRRYPELTDLERRFEALRRRMLSGTGVTLAPPTNFEGDRFQVSFSFRNDAELRARLQATQRLEEAVDELLELLF
ncbi:MAG: hypothetical protein R6U25_03945 [Alkalispirochaeta sp.]